MRNLSELSFADSAPAVTEDDLQRFERTIGFQLPMSYRAFLKEVNGGYPKLDTFQTESGDIRTASAFYQLTFTEDSEDLLWNYTMYQKVLPPWLLPIAYDGGGNQILLDLSSEQHGRVLTWDHETGSVWGGAKSFEAFVDSLYLNPEYI